MGRVKVCCEKLLASRGRSDEHGVALVTALLLLMLLTGMTVAMVLSVRSDMLSNGYYRNFRSSFYAADSGLAIVRQDMANQVLADINPNTNATQVPLTANEASNVITALAGRWAGNPQSASSYHDITIAGSVPARFTIDPNNFSLTPTGCTLTQDTNQYDCGFQYRIVSIGSAGGHQQNRIEESGTLDVAVPYGYNMPTTFAGYGLYVTNQDVCSGSYWAPGTVYGPVATGGCFTFSSTGNYIFTDTVNCSGPNAGYQFSNGCDESNTPFDTRCSGHRCTTIAPTFGGGINFNATMPTLPQNDFRQQNGVITGQESDPATQPDASLLKDVHGNTLGSNTSGVFMNYDSSNTFQGGGFYIVGDADVSLSTAMTTAPAGYSPCSGAPAQSFPQQIYTIAQTTTTGSGRTRRTTTTTTTITVTAVPNCNWQAGNPSSGGYTLPSQGITTVSDGTNTITINGIPTVKDSSGNIIDNGALVYSTGNINSLSGQVQDDTALTVTANNDINVTGNLTYKTPPIDMSNDSIITANDKGQALGLYTNNGNVVINSPSSNIEIDASIATISQNGATNGNIGGLQISNSSHFINNLNIVGGRVNNNLFTTSLLGTRNIYFDKRFGANLTPPFFPLTTRGSSSSPNGAPTATFSRTHWVNQTSY